MRKAMLSRISQQLNGIDIGKKQQTARWTDNYCGPVCFRVN